MTNLWIWVAFWGLAAAAPAPPSAAAPAALTDHAGTPRSAGQAVVTAGPITGTVRDEDGAPIAQAHVIVASAGRETLTNDRGGFLLRSVPPGRHVLRVSRIGYAPARREVEVPEGGSPAPVEIVLTATPLSLPGVQVTGTTASRDPLMVAQATTQLAGRALERELGASLAQTLAAQPGIAMRSMGPAATMPVMRGLTGDRILVLQDGQRAGDLAGSADDHGVTIDPLVVERVEVIRGPATLLYGNNALGGVVNVISGDIPSRAPSAPEWAVGAQTETAHPGGSGSVKVTFPVSDRWAMMLRGGARRTGDMRIPDDPVLGDRLDNTASRNRTGAAGLGYAGESLTGGVSMQIYDFAYGLPVPPDADPVSLRGRRHEASGRLEADLPSRLVRSVRLDASVQDYGHDELDDATGEVAQEFALRTGTANVLLRQGRVGPMAEGAWGASALLKDYAAAGPAALTPPAASRGLGLFGVQELSLGVPALELGARFDDYRIASRAHAKFGPGRERVFRALSGSVGLRVPLGDGVSAGLSLARSFRAPTVEELFSDAAHAGTGAVELGDPALQAERGLSVEGVVRVHTSQWNGQLAAYRNAVDDYVYLAARGDTLLGGTRLPVLAYTQDRAVLQGVEGSVEWAATASLVLGAMGDYLHAERADGTPLSFMPPPRLGALARWDRPTFTIGGDAHHELRQDRVGAADERPTPAHTVVRLHAGVRFRLGRRLHSLTLRAENLTNELHREATSRIKDFAPGPGRNLALVYRVRW